MGLHPEAEFMREFLERNRKDQIIYQTAKFGSVSVVVSTSAYCTPRTSEGPHTHVEIGMWTRGPEYLNDYAESLDEPEGELRVYAYVPIELLGRMLADV